MSLIERAEQALAAWRAGSINHALHLELAKLVEEFHAAAIRKPKPVAPVVPPKDAEAD